MRGIDALALALSLRRVAGPRLDADGKAELGDGGREIAVNIDGERLQGRDIERVEPGARMLGEIDEARQEPGQRLAAARRRDEQRRLPAFRRRQQLELVAVRRPAARGEPADKE